VLALLDSLQIILTAALLVVCAFGTVAWARSRSPSAPPNHPARIGQSDHGTAPVRQVPDEAKGDSSLPAGTVTSREEHRARISQTSRTPPAQALDDLLPTPAREPALPDGTVTSRAELRARLAQSGNTPLAASVEPSPAEPLPAGTPPAAPAIATHPWDDKIAWAIDCETTGLESHDRIVCLGAVELRGMVPTGNVMHLVFNPSVKSHWAARRKHGWDDWTLQHQQPFALYAPQIHAALAAGDLIVGHNLEFDMEFLGRELRAAGLPALAAGAYCTMQAFRERFPDSRANLDTCIAMIGGSRQSNIHGALEDAFLAAYLYRWLVFGQRRWVPLPVLSGPINLKAVPPGQEKQDGPQEKSSHVATAGSPSLADLATALAQINGTMRTATENQLRAVGRLGMGDLPGLSFDQASALLSAKRYSEGIIHAEIGVMDGYENEQWIEAKLVEFIISDAALRERVVSWSARSFARGGAHVPRPKRDEHYAKVRGYLQELFDATIEKRTPLR
jgi:DNA polymerase-3 subunit epsilon